MSDQSRSVSLALRWALLLGIMGDLLFRDAEVGLNVPIWVASVGAGWMVTRSSRQPLTSQQGLLLSLALCSAATFVLRDAPMLRLAGVIGLGTCATLLPLAGASLLERLQLRQCFQALGGLFHRLMVGFIPSMFEAQRSQVERGSLGVLRAIGRGIALAVPALAIFGSLLASADAGFQHLVERLFHFNAEALIEHGLLIGAFGWLAASLAGQPAPGAAALSEPGRPGRLGPIEAGVVLGSLDLTFLVFVLLQGRYFFGGDALVRSTDGLTYSAYARRGFFELVAVTALVLPLLLGFRAQLHNGTGLALRVYRVTAGALTALTLVIVGSALHRMTIYQREFGLTEQRFYASAFIAGLAFTLVWFAATVLRERPGRFLSGGLMSWTAWAAVLVLGNPAAMIAKVNIQRAAAGHGFDVPYVASLGADAVPALVNGLNTLPPNYRFALASVLHHRWDGAAAEDWRSWSLADWRARDAVRLLNSAQSTTPTP